MSVKYYDVKRGQYVQVFADKVYFTSALACIEVSTYNTVIIDRIHLLEVRAI